MVFSIYHINIFDIKNISKEEEYVQKRNHLTQKHQDFTKGNKAQKITGHKSLLHKSLLL